MGWSGAGESVTQSYAIPPEFPWQHVHLLPDPELFTAKLLPLTLAMIVANQLQNKQLTVAFDFGTANAMIRRVSRGSIHSKGVKR
jgi:hypothetical protein